MHRHPRYPSVSVLVSFWPSLSLCLCAVECHVEQVFCFMMCDEQLCQFSKELFTLLDLCVSSLRRGHANLLCIVPILTDEPRRESNCATVRTWCAPSALAMHRAVFKRLGQGAPAGDVARAHSISQARSPNVARATKVQSCSLGHQLRKPDVASATLRAAMGFPRSPACAAS